MAMTLPRYARQNYRYDSPIHDFVLYYTYYMSSQNVQFREDSEWQKSSVNHTQREVPSLTIVGFLEKKGVGTRAAYWILIGISLVCIIITIVVLRYHFGDSASYRDQIYLEDIPFEVQINLPQDVLDRIPSRYD